MSSSYSPTAEFTDSTTVLADGDAANATNLNAAPKKALDRAAYLRAATDGLLVWNGRARVAPGGASSGNTGVYCPPIEAVSLLDGSTWRAFSLSSETQLTTAAHFGGGTLTNSTWYYVYAYVSGGVLALLISTDAPGSDGIWRTSSVGTHRYLFAFRTNASGVAIPMQRTSGGRYYWRLSAISSGHSVTSYTATQAYTDLSLAAFVPPHARMAHLHVEAINVDQDSDDIVAARFRTNGDTTAYEQILAHPAVGVATHDSGRDRLSMDIETDSSQLIEVEISGDSASFAVNVFARGFSE